MKTTLFGNEDLKHLLHNQAIALVGDATGLPASAVPGNLYISLHTSSPGAAGNQGTNEASYTGYARVAVPRNNSNWLIEDNTATNMNTILFGINTGDTQTITHVGIGTSPTGEGKLLFYRDLVTPVEITAAVIPEFLPGNIDISSN